MRTMKHLMLATAAAAALTLAGCGGGGSSPASMTEQQPTPYDTAKAAIAAATTAADAQAAYDAVKGDVTAAQGDMLQAAVDARQAALAMMARAEMQRTALMAAAGMVDTSDLSTQELVTAARTALAAFRGALDDADDLTAAEKQMYQDQFDTAEMALDDAQGGIDTATHRSEQMATLKSASEALATALTAITGKTPTAEELEAVQTAKNALDMAVADAADLTDAEKQPYALQASNAADPVTAAANAVAKAEAERKAREARAAQLILNAASIKVAEAINKHRVTDIEANNPPAEFLDTNTTDPTNILTITRLAGAAKITPYQDSADKKNKPFMTGAAQDAGTGWSGMTFTRSGTAAKKAYTEMAVVYTDIEQAKAQLWATAFTGVTGLTPGTGGTIAIGSGASLDAMHFTGILPSAPASGESTTVTIDADAHKTGSFYGVSGDFECGSTDCVVTRASNGKVSVTGSDLTFTPDEYDAETTMAAYANDDDDYTHFGYWTQKTKQRDGSYVHDIETFFGGMGGTVATLTDIEGTAKYYGAAAGVYVKKEGAGDTLVVSDGMFTADAMLTAKFGGNTVAVADQNTVSGTISSFMDGSMDLGFADLVLGKSTVLTTTGSSFSGETNGGGTSGDWRAQFYGNAGAGAGTTAADDYPANVAGKFNGHFVNGHVAGAFGAEKD